MAAGGQRRCNSGGDPLGQSPPTLQGAAASDGEMLSTVWHLMHPQEVPR